MLETIGAALLALLFAFFYGRRKARNEEKIKELKQYQKTTKEMRNAETGSDDPGVLRDWLRERGKK